MKGEGKDFFWQIFNEFLAEELAQGRERGLALTQAPVSGRQLIN